VAADLGLEYAKADNVGPGDPLPLVGISRELNDSLNGLKAGEAGQAVALPGNRIAMASVTGVNPAHPSTFEEVQNQVKDALVNEKAAKLTDAKVQELMDKAKSMGDLEKAAKSMGFEAKTQDGVMRSTAIEGLGAASYITDAFAKPAGTLLPPVSFPSDKAIVKVLAHDNPDPAGLAKEKDNLREQLKSQKAREREKLFEAGLVEALTKSGKIKIHKEVVDRLTANFRG
jgi:hypothetical protein